MVKTPNESTNDESDDGHITIHLEEVLARQEMTMTELAERVGITLANMSILKTGKAKAVRFTTLAAICQTLNCQPGDIIHHEPANSPEPGGRDDARLDSGND